MLDSGCPLHQRGCVMPPYAASVRKPISISFLQTRQTGLAAIVVLATQGVQAKRKSPARAGLVSGREGRGTGYPRLPGVRVVFVVRAIGASVADGQTPVQPPPNSCPT